MIVTLIVIALGVSLTRFIPFYVLKDKTPPQSMQVLLDNLPYATMGLLVVYAFKDLNTSILLASVLASGVCVVLYLWKRNTVLSILCSTLLYMVIIQNF